MANGDHKVDKAYKNLSFLGSRAARPIRILSEYLEPESRFNHFQVEDTIVFMGSARAPSELDADVSPKLAEYYQAARKLAQRLTTWSKGLGGDKRRFVVCTGGGPGIMEAANRGASEAKGINIGLNISIPHEQAYNPYITRELNFEFHYFFMRKFWFVYLAKAIVFFPGGFGTCDEFFELMTLRQTQKLTRPLPIILFGSEFWDAFVDFDVMVEYGTIDKKDLDLFHKVDSVEDAFEILTRELDKDVLYEENGL